MAALLTLPLLTKLRWVSTSSIGADSCKGKPLLARAVLTNSTILSGSKSSKLAVGFIAASKGPVCILPFQLNNLLKLNKYLL